MLAPMPVVLVLLAVLCAFVRPAAAEGVRERLSLNADWRFHKGDLEGQGPLDDSGWRRLDLPHDWGIEGPFDLAFPGESGKLPWWGTAWYRKRHVFSAADLGRQLYLDVDGAMSDSKVWLNGRLVGGWPYGYTSYRLDLTPFAREGENLLAIRLDNAPDSSRWYPGGGIYRNVWLVKTAPVHVAHRGTFVTTPEVTARSARVDVQLTIDNKARAAARTTVRASVYALDPEGRPGPAPVAESAKGRLDVAGGGQATTTVALTVREPRLWSTTAPNLYLARTTVEHRGRVIDREDTVFGIRTFRFDPDQGFLLNGERVPIRGVCNHHDLGALGGAFNRRAARRQLEILQEMGANAIRTSHNPPAPELLDLTDRMGLLVMVEAFDAWKTHKKKNDYGRWYDEWHEKDLRAMVRRDRNHPSVILWSTGNEVQEQNRPEGAEMAARLAAIVREEDRTRPVTGGHNARPAGVNGYQKAFDVFGYNYRTDMYPKFRAANPAQPLLASETASTVSSRGEYFFPVTAERSGGRSDFQVSSYDLYTPGWGLSPDAQFRVLDENPWIAGEFVWTGFDYLGEPTPYNRDQTNLLNFSDAEGRRRMEAELKELGKIRPPSRSSYFGIVDLAGFPKDRYYLYQSRWRSERPMAHLLPHWTWPERAGETTPVHLYTSGDEAELFLNGRSLGRKKKGPYEYRLRWEDAVYEPGEIRAVAYKGGREWATAVQKTAGPAAALEARADRGRIDADGRDLAFVTVRVLDKEGVLVPRAKNRIRFRVDAPGLLVATDNGDATSHESFPSPERNAYNGLTLAIVRAPAAGTIRLVAEAEGLTAAEVTIESVPPADLQ